MKILVTGATGYFGGHICEFLQNKGHEVIGLIRNPQKSKFLDTLGIPYEIADLSSKESMDSLDISVDLVVHTAGYVSDRGPISAFREVNYDGTVNLVQYMSRKDIKRIIHISTLAVYGQVGNTEITENTKKNRISWFKYGLTKLESEEILLTTDFTVTLLRAGHIVGRRDRKGFIPILYHTAKKRPEWVENGDIIVPLVYVDDVCQAVILSIRQETKVESYNVVSNEQTTVRDVITQLHDQMDIPLPEKNRSFRSLFFMATFFEFWSKFGFKPPFTKMTAVLIGKNFHAKTEKIQQQLGWKPSKSNAEAIQEWIDWRREYELNRKK
ncbi:MAG: NAD(P)-dependent oxidoreductase [Candidatus Heimdallarchaeota archaeon]|nr:NAD(P)-dependent oxidoreductase [Candidatus Heimdallarchaeota archaeon]